MGSILRRKMKRDDLIKRLLEYPQDTDFSTKAIFGKKDQVSNPEGAFQYVTAEVCNQINEKFIKRNTVGNFKISDIIQRVREAQGVYTPSGIWNAHLFSPNVPIEETTQKIIDAVVKYFDDWGWFAELVPATQSYYANKEVEGKPVYNDLVSYSLDFTYHPVLDGLDGLEDK